MTINWITNHNWPPNDNNAYFNTGAARNKYLLMDTCLRTVDQEVWVLAMTGDIVLCTANGHAHKTVS